jgi:hypothetical protein
MSLFLGMELEEPTTPAAGCDDFLAFETIKSDLDEAFLRNPAVELCVDSTLGVVCGVKWPLFAEERGANLASSTNYNSASRA